jgi:hypothetical protein
VDGHCLNYNAKHSLNQVAAPVFAPLLTNAPSPDYERAHALLMEIHSLKLSARDILDRLRTIAKSRGTSVEFKEIDHVD